MKARTMLAIALALAGCKGKDKAAEGTKTGTGTGTGSGTGTGTGAAIDAAPAPLVVKLPDALPTSTHAVALEPNIKLFVTLDTVGGTAIGMVPADPKSAWPAPRSMAVTNEVLSSLREGLAMGEDAAALDKRLAAIPAPDPRDMPVVKPLDYDDLPMALDEGKMGARGVGGARSLDIGALSLSDEAYAGLGNPTPPPDVKPADRHVASGLVWAEADDGLGMIVLADGAAEAGLLIAALEPLNQVALGVRDASGAAARSAVRFGFPERASPDDPSFELLVDVAPDGVTVREGPGATLGAAAWTADAIDAASLATAWKQGVGNSRRTDATITVASGVSVARLVSVADALIDAGAKELNVRNWTRPVLHGPVVQMGRAEIADGELDVKAIRPAVAGVGDAIKLCYQEALTADPTAQGDADVAVILDPGATIKDVVVQGLAPVTKCTKDALTKMTFTHSDGGQVAFHFQLRFRMFP